MENKNINTIVIDDGSKTYEIKNKQGKNWQNFVFAHQIPTLFRDMRM